MNILGGVDFVSFHYCLDKRHSFPYPRNIGTTPYGHCFHGVGVDLGHNLVRHVDGPGLGTTLTIAVEDGH